MKRNTMLHLGCALALTIAITATNGIAQSSQSHADLDDQFMYHRAIEAVIWSMPAMADVFFRESLFRDYGMKPDKGETT